MWKLKRTQTCGELRAEHAGKSVVLNGWVDARRNFGNLIFIDLRDRYGRTQVLFSPDRAAALVEQASKLGKEWVVAVRGVVRKRDADTVNAKIPTGEIEVDAVDLEIVNEAKTTPFEVTERINVAEEMRLQHRYLDLRRPTMQRNILTRSKIVHAMREHMDAQGFLDIETPYMVKFTPGGARNFLCPSRLYPGRFFALAESPQIFKQLFMVSGLDKYYQIARCFRDEDLRADRQLEFTQLDIEMSFVQREDVMNVIEGCVVHVWKKVGGVEVPRPFPVITYEESERLYGTDKPDLRFGMKIWDLTDAAPREFKVFGSVIEAGGVVRGLTATGCASWSRKQTDELETYVKGIGAKGLVTLKVEQPQAPPGSLGVLSADCVLAGSAAKFFAPPQAKAIIERAGAKPGDLLLLVADAEEKAASVLGGLRLLLRDKLGLVKPGTFQFCWVVDFPMFEVGEDGSVGAKHHPFTSPKDEFLDVLEKEPMKVKAKAYDLVLNGVELGGGSIRIHRRDVQQRIFKLLGLTEEYTRDRFGFLLDAFEYGAPPHGGIALGLDRVAMLLLGLDNIRDVITFPKTQSTVCLMTGAPGTVTEKQLKELHVRVVDG
ncbi:MAG: aspartate--tRNA ligase [Planctomycetes bacterium]|nr:aspartate--tRNA ligase [Planctomycetota bacterium]